MARVGVSDALAVFMTVLLPEDAAGQGDGAAPMEDVLATNEVVGGGRSAATVGTTWWDSQERAGRERQRARAGRVPPRVGPRQRPQVPWCLSDHELGRA